MYFGLLRHLFQDFEGDTVMLQNVIIAANCYITAKFNNPYETARSKYVCLRSSKGLVDLFLTFQRQTLCLERLGNVLKEMLDP